MNPKARPDLTYAVLVGVDTYSSPRLPPLNGPALDACRHARWLRSRGVPAVNIRLLLSPGEQSRVRTAALAEELGIAPRPATQAEVERVLVDELPEWRGDLLWFAWSGHGILDDLDQQRLFCTDARPAYEVNLPMGELEQTLLHDRRYEGIREKICVVDACRVFDVPASSLPHTLSLGRTDTADGEGYLQSVCATQDGRTAANLGAQGSGLFTSYLMAELKRSPAWPPDLPTVLAAVKARMGDAAVLQIPYLVERRRTGDRPEPFGSRARLSPHIRTHAEEVARLGGKGSHLVSDTPVFVSPCDGSDPRRLFARLAGRTAAASEQESKRGVLLIGPAGAGKTRTCFEMAKAALDQKGPPWQVLHVARSPEVSADDVMAAVREQAGRRSVLLIFDYLDGYEALNLEALGEALRTEDPQGRVVCVASVRPGMLGKLRENGVGRLLDEVPLRSDREHTTKVISQIFVDVAPGMLKAWDVERLSKVCGQRPIIALLIARELESRREARPDELDLVPPRSEDLIFWLQHRTQQDFGERAGETLLLASAVAAASCEQDQDAVESAVRRFLDRWPDHTFRDGPEGVVGRLLHLGWLVESGQGIDAVHDIVTDELLRRAVLPDGTTIRGEVLKALLSAFLADEQTFGVASRHLRRWTADLGDTLRRPLERACANWLVDHADEMAALVGGGPKAGRSVMLTMLSGPPWRKGVEDTWNRLVGPWLEETEERDPAAAATVLAGAVRNCVGDVPERLTDACLAWVTRQWTTRDVSQLLRALLEADAVPARDCDRVAEHVLGWCAQQPAMTRAGARLLASLLRRADLGADRAVAAVDLSLAWMRQNKRNPDAGLVLRPLLLRGDLDEARRTDAAGRALAWLGVQTQPSVTALVLDAALRGDNLRADKADRVTRSALTWLEGHKTHIDASFVLEPLLARGPREAADARAVLDHAFAWLVPHASARRATYVLARVLHRDDLGARRAATAIDAARTWLRVHGLIGDAKFLLSALLNRSDIDRESEQRLAEKAVTWLNGYGLDNGGQYVVAALLRPDADGAHVDRAARTALALLAGDYPRAQARSTLAHVLRCRGVGPETLRDAVSRALDLLAESEPEFEATYVLGPLLERRRFLGARTSRAVALALDWLGRHGTRPEASFVLDPLLALTAVGAEEREAIETAAREWLTGHWRSEEARFVLSRLLQSRHARDWSEPVETRAVEWLRLHEDHPHASHVVVPLLQRFGADRPAEAVERALNWLRTHPTAEGVPHVVSALAMDQDMDLDEYGRCVDGLLELLDAQPQYAAALLGKVWLRGDLDPDRAVRLAEHVLGALEDEETPPDRGPLVGLLRLDLGPEHQCRAVRLAFRRLEDSTDQSARSGVLDVLLKRDDLRSDQLAGALRAAEALVTCLESTGSSALLGRLLGSLLGNPGVDGAYRIDATRRALRWLDANGARLAASNVLVVLLDRLDLAPEDGERVAAHADTWLETVDSESRRRLTVQEALRRYRERRSDEVAERGAT